MDLRDKDKRPDYDSMIPYDSIMKYLQAKFPRRCFRLSGECPYRPDDNDETINIELMSNDGETSLSDLADIEVIDVESGETLKLLDLLNDNTYELKYTQTSSSKFESITRPMGIEDYRKNISDLYVTKPSDFIYTLDSTADNINGVIVNHAYIILTEYIGTEIDIYIPNTMSINSVTYKVMIGTPTGVQDNKFFRNYLTLENIIIGDEIVIQDGTKLFYHCYRLEYAKCPHINIPEGTTNSGLFTSCYSLKGVELENIPVYAFDFSCYDLKNMSNIVNKAEYKNPMEVGRASTLLYQPKADEEYSGYTPSPLILGNSVHYTLPNTESIRDYGAKFESYAENRPIILDGYIDNTATNVYAMFRNSKCIDADLYVNSKLITTYSGFAANYTAENNISKIVMRPNNNNYDLVKTIVESEDHYDVYYPNDISDFEYQYDKETQRVILNRYIGTGKYVYVSRKYRINGRLYNTYIESGYIYNKPADTIIPRSFENVLLSKNSWVKIDDNTYECTIVNNFGAQALTECNFFTSVIPEKILDQNTNYMIRDLKVAKGTLTKAGWFLNDDGVYENNIALDIDISDINHYEIILKDHENLLMYITNSRIYKVDDQCELKVLSETTTALAAQDIAVTINEVFDETEDTSRAPIVANGQLLATNWIVNEYTGIWENHIGLDIDMNNIDDFILTIPGHPELLPFISEQYLLSIEELEGQHEILIRTETYSRFKDLDLDIVVTEKYDDVGYINSVVYTDNSTLKIRSTRNPNVNLFLDYTIEKTIEATIPGNVLSIRDGYVTPGCFTNNKDIKSVYFEEGVKLLNDSAIGLFTNCTSLSCKMDLFGVRNIDYAIYGSGISRLYLDIPSGGYTSFKDWCGPGKSIAITINRMPNSGFYNLEDGTVVTRYTSLDVFNYNTTKYRGKDYVSLYQLTDQTETTISFPAYYLNNGKRYRIMISESHGPEQSANGLFYNNDKITNVIGSHVTIENSRADYLFYKNTNLERCTISLDSPLFSVVSTFEGCSKLKSDDFIFSSYNDNVADATRVFKDCTLFSTTPFGFNNGIKSIRSAYENTAITRVQTLQPTLVDITRAFKGCGSLSTSFSLGLHPMYNLRAASRAFDLGGNVLKTPNIPSDGFRSKFLIGNRLYHHTMEPVDKSININPEYIRDIGVEGKYKVAVSDLSNVQELTDYLNTVYDIGSVDIISKSIINTTVPKVENEVIHVYKDSWVYDGDGSYTNIVVLSSPYTGMVSSMSISNNPDFNFSFSITGNNIILTASSILGFVDGELSITRYNPNKYLEDSHFGTIDSIVYDIDEKEFTIYGTIESDSSTEKTVNQEITIAITLLDQYIFNCTFNEGSNITIDTNLTTYPTEYLSKTDISDILTTQSTLYQVSSTRDDELREKYILNDNVSYYDPEFITETLIDNEESGDIHLEDPDNFTCEMEYCPSHIYTIYKAYWYACYYHDEEQKTRLEIEIMKDLKHNFYMYNAITNEKIEVNEMTIYNALTDESIKTISKAEDGGLLFTIDKSSLERIRESLKGTSIVLKLI